MATVVQTKRESLLLTFAERETLLWSISRKYVKGKMPRRERWAYERRYGHTNADQSPDGEGSKAQRPSGASTGADQ